MKWLILRNVTTNGSKTCIFFDMPKSWSSLEIFDYIITGPLFTLVLSCGFFGGLICILTFYRCLPKLEVYRHLLTLAIWDLFHVIFAFLAYNIQVLIHDENLSFGSTYVTLLPFFYYACCVTRFGSIWTVMALAFHKFAALCHPFGFWKWGDKAHGRLVIGGVALGAMLLSLPRAFEMMLEKCGEVTTDQTVNYLVQSPFRQHMIYWFIYRVIGGMLFYSLMPFCVLLYLTCRLWIEVRRLLVNFPRRQQARASCGSTLLVSLMDPVLENNVNGYAKHTVIGATTVIKNGGNGYQAEAINMLPHSATGADETKFEPEIRRPSNIRRSSPAGSGSIQSYEAAAYSKSRSGSKAKALSSSLSAAPPASPVTAERMNHSMHLLVITKFLLCHLFPSCLDILESVDMNRQASRRLFSDTTMTILAGCSTFMVGVNSSSNFLIYYLTSLTFKSDCKRTMKCLFGRLFRQGQ